MSVVIFMMSGILCFECPAMQCVRDQYPDLFSPAKYTMQLVSKTLGGWHTTSRIVLRCLVPLMMLPKMKLMAD